MGAGDKPKGSDVEPTLVVPPPRMIAGKYQLGRMLGEGGMGTVYEAEHVELGKRVAIKLLAETFAEDETFVKRFRREARALAAVQSDHIVQVTDTGTDEEGIPFIVMELLDGESLASILRRERAIAEDIAAEIACQMLAGLAAAHEKGIIHRDLKPANVFLVQIAGGGQRAKILDFGISKFREQWSAVNVTAEGAVVGTPAYMSPEQVKGSSDVDHRIDIYAVGVILYRMVTGRLPFPGVKPREIYDRILRGQPVRPRDVADCTAEMESVIMKAMAARPEDRWPDANAFIEALREAVPNARSSGPVPLLTRSGSFPPPRPSDSGEIAPPRLGSPGAPAAATPSSTAPTDRTAQREAHRQGRRTLLSVAAIGVGLAAVAIAFFATDWGSDGGDGSDTPEATPGDTAEAVPTPPEVNERPPLLYGVSQYLAPEDIHETHDPLVRHLSEALGRPVELSITSDFELGDRLVEGEVALAALSAYHYVRLKNAHPDIRLLATAVNPGGSSYAGQILARPDSGLTTLTDLVGHGMCFPSPDSTSGYLYPRALLRQQGIDPDTAFRATYFHNGDHAAAVRALYRGQCDAAAVYQGAVERAGFDPQTFHTIATTPRIPYDAYCLSSTLTEAEAEAVRTTLLALAPDTAATQAALGEDNQLRGFVRAADTDYDTVRQIVTFVDRGPAPQR